MLSNSSIVMHFRISSIYNGINFLFNDIAFNYFDNQFIKKVNFHVVWIFWKNNWSLLYIWRNTGLSIFWSRLCLLLIFVHIFIKVVKIIWILVGLVVILALVFTLFNRISLRQILGIKQLILEELVLIRYNTRQSIVL